MIKYYDEYRKSLKQPEAEEILDLLFYRPLAYFIVKIIYKSPISPNQISLLSLAAGLISAYFFSIGELKYFRIGAFVFLTANLLDCMDGQLARLQGSGTFFGRVIDGVADYITGFAVFIAMGIGLQNDYSNIWYLVLLAGISTIIHGVAYDYYQSEFIQYKSGKINITADDIKKYSMEKIEANDFKIGQKILVKIYKLYLLTQGKSILFFPKPKYIGKEETEHQSMIRWWSFIGPTTNRSILIIFCLIGAPVYYLYFVVGAGNLWFVICLIRQYLFSTSREG